MVVFVCTGNTCRSPMAAALATQLIKAQVVSAGVYAGDGYPASQNAVQAMADMGIDIKNHQSTQLTTELLENASLVLTMTASHLHAVKTLNPTVNAYTLGAYANTNTGISDPFGGDLNIYKSCATQINTLLQNCLQRLKTELEEM